MEEYESLEEQDIKFIMGSKRKKIKIGECNKMPNVNLPSFNENSDPNVYLGWEAKVEQIFSVYDVDDRQPVKLVSLEFKDYAMPWWHKTIMNIRLNKRSNVISWSDLKQCIDDPKLTELIFC